MFGQEETLVDDPEISKEVTEESHINAEENSCITSVPAGSTSQFLVPSVTPVIPVSDSGIVPTVHNVVCTVDLGCKLDLLKIAMRLRNAEYNPRRFHAVIMRILQPKTASLIFRSGKIVVTGARNESAAHLAARKYARLIQKLGFDVRFIDFKIQNMVASCDVKFPIHLETLYTSLHQYASYEPELFPGLIFRLFKPKVASLIFVSGKIILTGAKNRTDLKEAFERIYPLLKNVRKK